MSTWLNFNSEVTGEMEDTVAGILAQPLDWTSSTYFLKKDRESGSSIYVLDYEFRSLVERKSKNAEKHLRFSNFQMTNVAPLE